MGDPGLPPYFWTKMRPEGTEIVFLRLRPPPYLRVWMTGPLPLSEGLDPPLHLYIKYQVATLSYSIIYIYLSYFLWYTNQ